MLNTIQALINIHKHLIIYCIHSTLSIRALYDSPRGIQLRRAWRDRAITRCVFNLEKQIRHFVSASRSKLRQK